MGEVIKGKFGKKNDLEIAIQRLQKKVDYWSKSAGEMPKDWNSGNEWMFIGILIGVSIGLLLVAVCLFVIEFVR